MSLISVTKRVTSNWARLGTSFWKVWGATTISSMGDGVRYIAIPLLAANLTKDPVLVSLVTTAEYLPLLLFSLASGVLVDRYNHAEIMWRVNFFRTSVVLLFAGAVALGLANMTLLIVMVFILGATGVLFGTAAQSLIPSVVEKPDLPRANSTLAVGVDVAEQFIAPPLGALLFVAAIWMPFTLDAMTFAIAGLLLYSMSRGQRSHPTSQKRAGLRKEILEGITWLWRNKVVRSLCVMAGAFTFFSKATLAIEVLYVLQVLQLSEAEFGLLLTAIAIGSITGSLLVPTLTDRLGKLPALVVSVGSAVIACLGLTFTSSVFIAMPMFSLFGVSMTLWSVIVVSLRQALVPKDLLGRVNSAYRFISGGTAPLGALFGGFLAQHLGLRAPYLAGAALLAAVALITLIPIRNEVTIIRE